MCITASKDVDRILSCLMDYGIGSVAGSINVMDLKTSKFFIPEGSKDGAAEEEDIEHTGRKRSGTLMSQTPSVDEDTSGRKTAKLSMVTNQINIEQMLEEIESAANMGFDYVMLLIIASVIAGIGLAVNNAVAIIASMLVSPIMGPVLAVTFGATVHDWELCRLGLRSELLSLCVCLLVGFLIGLACIGVGTGGHWPTDEMRGRGVVGGLFIGLAIAIPSGMGVALSILGNNTSSLVGVAISASLLPPAVNCGMALAYAAMGFTYDPNAAPGGSERSFAELGGVSLALTAVNIGAIFVSAWLIFKLKEVSPLKNKSMLWQHGIEAFRAYTREAAQSSHATQGGDLEEGQQPAPKPRPKSLPLQGLPQRQFHRIGSHDDLSALPHSSPLGLNLLSATTVSPSRRHRGRQEKNLAELHELLSSPAPPISPEDKIHHGRKQTDRRSLDTSKVRLPSSAEPELYGIKDRLRRQGRPMGPS